MDEYCDEVNELLIERFGISLNDVSINAVEQAFMDGDSPEELVEHLGNKFELNDIRE